MNDFFTGGLDLLYFQSPTLFELVCHLTSGFTQPKYIWFFLLDNNFHMLLNVSRHGYKIHKYTHTHTDVWIKFTHHHQLRMPRKKKHVYELRMTTTNICFVQIVFTLQIVFGKKKLHIGKTMKVSPDYNAYELYA